MMAKEFENQQLEKQLEQEEQVSVPVIHFIKFIYSQCLFYQKFNTKLVNFT